MVRLEKLNVDLKNIAYKDELTGVNTIEKFKFGCKSKYLYT
ncbi:hypothetical protein [Clostridioides difficile]|nr:hypothetical protein [Clostridioides difficile]